MAKKQKSPEEEEEERRRRRTYSKVRHSLRLVKIADLVNRNLRFQLKSIKESGKTTQGFGKKSEKTQGICQKKNKGIGMAKNSKI